MKRKSIFGQLINGILIPIVLIIIILSVIYIRYNYKTRVTFNEQKKNILIEELKTLIEFEDIALAMIEEQLTQEMEKYSQLLVSEVFKETSQIKDIDLHALKTKHRSDYDIYIIDTTGEIINTTFEKDLGFNLFNINEEHKEFLQSILKNNAFVSERFSLEVSTGKQKKYTYQPSIDKNYIIELGSYSAKATNIINSMNLGIQMLTQNIMLNIVSVDLFISQDNKKSFNSENFIEEEHVGIYEKSFINKANYDTVINTNRQILLYDYVYFNRNQTNLYSESLIRIVFDITNDQNKLKKEFIFFSIILTFTIIFLFVLFYKKAKSLTLPLASLEQQVKLIESGDLSKRATVSGNNEITSLSVHFNSMIGKLESLYQNLENKVKERTSQLQKKQEDITSSIQYAKRIQKAVLPSLEKVIEALPNSFIYFKPKAIVSGDFYWMTQKEDKIIIAAVDCTGHGVPGGFMSMLGVAFLNEIVNKIEHNKHIYSLTASNILNELRTKVIEALNQTGKVNENRDGMDIALCIIDYENHKLQFSGANNPLILVHNNELTQIKGDKKSISYDKRMNESFINHEINFEDNDMIYIYSDGFQDQFGGENDRKFSQKRFRELLLNIADNELEIQKEILDKTINNWRGEKAQIDDILVIGIRLKQQIIPKKADSTDWSNKKILIAEDNEFNYLLLVEALIETKINIVKAENGVQAVEMCKNHSDIDLVLMDVNMPKMNGFEASTQIKQINPTIPIIIQTAFDLPEIAKQSNEAGCVDYFTKPIQFDRFIETIAKHLFSKQPKNNT